MKKYLFCTILLFSCQPAEKKQLIEVSGQCLDSFAQDRAKIVITVEQNHAQSEIAAEKAQALYNQLSELIRDLDLQEAQLQTTQFNLFEDFTWEDRKRVSQGYKCQIGLEVSTSEISRIGQVIEQAQKLRLNRIGNLQTYASLSLLQEKKKECLAKAFENAKEKAQRLADAAGMKIISVQNMQESRPSSSPHFEPMMMAKAESQPLQVDSKDFELSLEILVQFIIQ